MTSPQRGQCLELALRPSYFHFWSNYEEGDEAELPVGHGEDQDRIGCLLESLQSSRKMMVDLRQYPHFVGMYIMSNDLGKVI